MYYDQKFNIKYKVNNILSNRVMVISMDKETYSDVRIRKVRILKGKAREAAEAVGAKDDDLVILRTSEYHSEPTYTAEKVEGDPVSYLMRQKQE